MARAASAPSSVSPSSDRVSTSRRKSPARAKLPAFSSSRMALQKEGARV